MLGHFMRTTTVCAGLLVAVAAMVLSYPGTAHAQTLFACDAIADDGDADGNSRIGNGTTGTCVDGSTTTEAEFDGVTTDQADFRVGIFDQTPAGGTTRIRIEHGDLISNVVAPGFTGTDPGFIDVPTANEFSITIQFDFNGVTHSFPVFKQAATSTISSFSATVANPLVDKTESDILTNQQSTLSFLIINEHARVLGDVVFDKLSDVFRPGVGTQISANGFSTSTSGVATWIDQKQQEKLQRQLADLPRDENGRQIYVAPVADFAPQKARKWDAWIKGSWTTYEGDDSTFDGRKLDVLAGFDYRANDTVVIGLLGGFGNADFDTLVAGRKGAFVADGYTVGTYVGVKPTAHLQFDALAAYTYSNYDNSIGSTDGNFAAHRVTVGAQLKGIWESGGFFIEPGARITYSEEQQNKYTDSVGVAHTSLSIVAGRASVGPKLGYVYHSPEGGLFRAWVAVKGEYDFSNNGNDNPAPASGLPDLADDVYSGRISAGFDASSNYGVSISVQGDISGLGSGDYLNDVEGAEYLAYGGSARVDLRF